MEAKDEMIERARELRLLRDKYEAGLAGQPPDVVRDIQLDSAIRLSLRQSEASIDRSRAMIAEMEAWDREADGQMAQLEKDLAAACERMRDKIKRLPSVRTEPLSAG